MDFLKNLTTSAISIPDWNFIAFHTYYIHSDPDPPQTRKPSQLLHLWTAETSLRKRGKFVSIDPDRGRLWIFEPLPASSGEGDVNVTAPDLSDEGLFVTPTSKPVRFPAVKFKARFPRPARIPPAISSTGVPQNVRQTQTAYLLAFQQNLEAAATEQEGFFENKLRYELLMKAIAGLVTYGLVKETGLLPCGGKRFLHLDSLDSDAYSRNENSPWHRVEVSELILNVELATAGTLLLSFSSHNRSEKLHLNKPQDNADIVEGQIIKILPGSLPARLVGFASDTEASEKELKVSKWKEFARLWLEGKGYLTDDDTQWVWISFINVRKPQPSESDTEFLWPSSLCFLFEHNATSITTTSTLLDQPVTPATELDASQQEIKDENLNPLTWAEQWFCSKEDRDNQLKSATKTEPSDECPEPEPTVQEIDFSLSPAYARMAVDMNSVSGMYPTPPDGFLPHGLQATQGDTPSIIMPSSVGPTTSTETMDLDNNVVADDAMEDHDDLFGDIGDVDEDFGEGGNDMDFSFFDEPGDAARVSETNAANVSLPSSNNREESLPPTTAGAESGPVRNDENDPLATLPDNYQAEEEDLGTSPDLQQVEQLLVGESTPPNNHNSLQETNGQISPPLSPTIVRSKLAASPTVQPDELGKRGTAHRNSIFNVVDFNKRLKLNDAKYQGDGPFSFNYEKKTGDSEEEKKTGAAKVPLSIMLPLKVSEDKEDMSDTSSITDFTEFEPKSAASGPGYLAFAPKKLDRSQAGTPAASQIQEVEVREEHVISENQIPLLLRQLELQSTASPAVCRSRDLTLQRMMEPDNNLDIFQSINGKELIMIAQTLVSQAIGSNFDSIFGQSQSITESRDLPTNLIDRQHGDINVTISQVIKHMFPAALPCELPRYINIQDFVPENPMSKVQQKSGNVRKPAQGGTSDSANSTGSTSNAVFNISPQRLRMRRNEAHWDLLPPAVPFWEALSVAPSSGQKDVKAWCVYLSTEDLTDAVDVFFESMASTFESYKLGSHSRGAGLPDFEDGIVQISSESSSSSIRNVLSAFRNTLIAFGTKLGSSKSAQDDAGNIVVYIVDPFGTPESLLRLCAGFCDFFNAYNQASPRVSPKADVLPHILPISRIANSCAPMVRDPLAIAELALEIYDHCPPNQHKRPTESGRLSIYAAPSIQLEEFQPERIPFRLSAEPPGDLLLDNSSMHLGYAVGERGEWVTVAWTDSCGKSQFNTSYSLKGRSFLDIAKEVWFTTLEIMRVRLVTWRVAIAKAGIMSTDEAEAWASLASKPCGITMTTLLLSFVDPPFELTSPIIARLASTNVENNVSTPAATPKLPTTPGPKAGVSPEPSSFTPAATPPDVSFNQATEMAKDPDAHLVDVTDEVWGAILNHRLDGQLSFFEDRAPLLSGLLIRRNGHCSAIESDHLATQGPTAIAVNLLWAGANVRMSSMPGAVSGNAAAQQQQQQSQQSQQQQQQLQRQPSGASARTGPMTPGSTPATATPNTTGSLDPSSAASSPAGTGPTTGQVAGILPGSEPWPPRPYIDGVFREYLTQMRGLALLARLRGLRGGSLGLTPWHLGVAMKGVRVLETAIGENCYEW